MVWAKAAKALQSVEVISMADVLPWTRKIKGPLQGFWLELDLKEMFVSIPRDAIVTALKFCLDANLHQRDNDYRKRDCTGFKSREFVYVFTCSDALRYVSFCLTIDCRFVGASSVFLHRAVCSGCGTRDAVQAPERLKVAVVCGGEAEREIEAEMPMRAMVSVAGSEAVWLEGVMV